MKKLVKIKNFFLQNKPTRKALYRTKITAMKTNPSIYANIRLQSFPKGIFIQTQSRCNAQCIVCPLADPHYRRSIPQGKMPDRLFKKIIEECSQHHLQEISPEFLNEPLMDTALEERIDYIRKKCPSTYIFIMTNGSLLEKNRAERLANSGLDRMCISVHGLSEETYRRNMGNLNFHKTLERINYFLSINKKIKVRVAIMENLLPKDEFQEALAYWKSRGVPVDIQQSNDRAGSVSNNSHVVWKPENTGKVVGCMMDYPLRYMAVHFNGDVVLCCYDWQREILLGNLSESSIYALWNSEKYQKIRNTIYGHCPSGFICDRCVIAARKGIKTASPLFD